MKKFIQQAGFAVEGIQYFFSTERHGKIHAVLSILVVTLGMVVKLNRYDWCILLLCIAVVLCAEMLNTAVERLCDLITLDHHPLVKVVKDVAAGAVLICAIIAAVIGILIFLPHVQSLFAVGA